MVANVTTESGRLWELSVFEHFVVRRRTADDFPRALDQGRAARSSVAPGGAQDIGQLENELRQFEAASRKATQARVSSVLGSTTCFDIGLVCRV